ncbi:MAG TPA: alginate lyase family protein [Pyrinomonadaceae bacterium]|nr:alginate lyase family protein [Pyrinomonadaceae bacterium]
MNYLALPKISLGFILLFLCGQIIFAQSPMVFLLNSKLLQERKQKILDSKSPDTTFNFAIAELEKEAKRALKTEMLSIVTKEANPPSGDKHDYMSQAPYFWRNPDTPNGFPYIRKDGERNPEIKRFPDHDLMDKMVEIVETLSLAYFFTNKEEYANKATEILRMWFLDPKTKMNPNLEFAQAIPGLNTGRGIGLIETRGLPKVIDSIGLLENSKSWTKVDQKGLENWFDQFLIWMTTSKNGLDEAAAKNNHGTYYDVQIVSFALFVGKKDFAKNILEKAKKNRIANQIEPDGRQPLELERTKSWSYSTMNLEGFVLLAELGENVGVDLWDFQTQDGRSIRKAIEFLSPYLDGKKKWTYQQIEAFQPEKMYSIIRNASRKYKDEKFIVVKSLVPGIKPEETDLLLF